MKSVRLDDGFQFTEFDSVTDLHESVLHGTPTNTGADVRQEYLNADRDEWRRSSWNLDDYRDVSDTLKLPLTGDSSKSGELDLLRKRVTDIVSERLVRLVPKRSYATNLRRGSRISAEKALAGHAAPYSGMARGMRPAPIVVSLLCSVKSTWRYTNEMTKWRGIACAVVADLLEEQGLRCEVLAGSVTVGPDTMVVTRLKEALDTLDLPKIVSVCGDLAHIRSLDSSAALMFSNQYVGAYGGKPSSIEKLAQTIEKRSGESVCLVIPDDCLSEEAAVRTVQSLVTTARKRVTEVA